ncbi:MerR family transcriptional regulator [Corynebacterium freiburgense]|uniref:MerR family transcriptional regulator n=1 Tax=Corynebacterium freiburgense TaxID=556548 RepID=UPI000401E7D3|nr:MerR family transcriptional regulator [Corynebacterium freiburgense]WJZ01806.1 HTH-type transcriptional regulator HmrR [Corynebacterium freiburgense]
MDGLLKIGMFSRLSNISIRMLRYYQNHGILTPAKVDVFNGHRFYLPEQVEDAQLVVQLRDAGYAVETIAEVLAKRENPVVVARLLEQQRHTLNKQRDELHARLAALDRLTCQLQGQATMTEVAERVIPAMTTASLRKIIETYHNEYVLWQEIEPLLQQADVTFPAGGISGAIFHDPEYRESDVDVEVWIQIAHDFPTSGALQCTQVPEQRVVSAVLHGDYSQMPTATRAIGTYLAERNLETDKMFNIYHISPAQTSDPSRWVTEVCFPIIQR